MSMASTVQTWDVEDGHTISTWLESHAMIPFGARCTCGWHAASASGGLRNWNVEGHVKDIRESAAINRPHNKL